MSNPGLSIHCVNFDENYKRVLRFAHRLCANRADAEDLTQETFFRAYRCAEETIDPRTYNSWLCRIARNLFLDLKRSQARRVKTTAFAPEDFDTDYQGRLTDPQPSAEDQMMAQEIDPVLTDAMDILKPVDRAIFWDISVKQMSYQEVANARGMAPELVRSRVWRATRRLRVHLRNQASQAV